MIPIDVTDQLRAAGHLIDADFNAEDRVYQAEDGALVKVKTFHETHELPVATPGGLVVRSFIDVLRVWGSVVGPDGKALVRADGAPAVYGFGRHITVQNETDSDVVRDAEVMRFACVEETLRAHRNYMSLQGLTGTGSRPARTLGVRDIQQLGGSPPAEPPPPPEADPTAPQ